jgi:hypothetical protein
MPGRIGEGNVHDPSSPLRMREQQLAIGGEPPDDVLGELGPVDPDDELPVADGVAQRPHPGLHIRLGGAAAQLGGVDAQRMHADAGDVARIADLLPSPVHLGAEEALAAVQEGIRPALAQESRVVGAQDPGQHLAADAVRQQAVVIGRRPGRMREMRDRDLGPQPFAAGPDAAASAFANARL